MSVDEPYSERERRVCSDVPIALDHVPDEETEDYDAVLKAAIASSTHGRFFGMIHVGVETPVEIKTCECWINDRNSAGDRRRGRFFVDREAHERLQDLNGVYLLAVVDDVGEPIAWGMAPPAELDDLLSWTSNGDSSPRSESSQLRWNRVFREEEVEIEIETRTEEGSA